MLYKFYLYSADHVYQGKTTIIQASSEKEAWKEISTYSVDEGEYYYL